MALAYLTTEDAIAGLTSSGIALPDPPPTDAIAAALAEIEEAIDEWLGYRADPHEEVLSKRATTMGYVALPARVLAITKVEMSDARVAPTAIADLTASSFWDQRCGLWLPYPSVFVNVTLMRGLDPLPLAFRAAVMALLRDRWGADGAIAPLLDLMEPQNAVKRIRIERLEQEFFELPSAGAATRSRLEQRLFNAGLGKYRDRVKLA